MKPYLKHTKPELVVAQDLQVICMLVKVSVQCLKTQSYLHQKAGRDKEVKLLLALSQQEPQISIIYLFLW
jgi:hypothetical protein